MSGLTRRDKQILGGGGAGVLALLLCAGVFGLGSGGDSGDEIASRTEPIATETTAGPVAGLLGELPPVTSVPATPELAPESTPATTDATPGPAAKPKPKPKPKPKATPKPKPKPKKSSKPPADVYYANCTAVRAAGADPIYAGDPGYSRKLDRDGDGVGCE